jgi:hypothetical protein
MGKKLIPTDEEAKRVTDGLMQTLLEGNPDQQQEARGLLGQFSQALGKERSRYIDIGRPRGSERSVTETGTIDEEGRKVPD